jgi:hypothetical protein
MIFNQTVWLQNQNGFDNNPVRQDHLIFPM